MKLKTVFIIWILSVAGGCALHKSKTETAKETAPAEAGEASDSEQPQEPPGRGC